MIRPRVGIGIVIISSTCCCPLIIWSDCIQSISLDFIAVSRQINKSICRLCTSILSILELMLISILM
ncbi:hypothetical protein T01_7025 [Trichinella spiralis]|uniref:Uncharacterized protein n=2 Tax=Trichinella TaxID=6333 RepID=A0A0V1AXQ9_TRISP|nr:hypothetical protein T05_2829 [Trichinella murrelli]KRY29469.1 hypothetical protein T01_7025 [Trichinella spiralis]